MQTSLFGHHHFISPCTPQQRHQTPHVLCNFSFAHKTPLIPCHRRNFLIDFIFPRNPQIRRTRRSYASIRYADVERWIMSSPNVSVAHQHQTLVYLSVVMALVMGLFSVGLPSVEARCVLTSRTLLVTQALTQASESAPTWRLQ